MHDERLQTFKTGQGPMTANQLYGDLLNRPQKRIPFNLLNLDKPKESIE